MMHPTPCRGILICNGFKMTSRTKALMVAVGTWQQGCSYLCDSHSSLPCIGTTPSTLSLLLLEFPSLLSHKQIQQWNTASRRGLSRMSVGIIDIPHVACAPQKEFCLRQSIPVLPCDTLPDLFSSTLPNPQLPN